MHPSGARGTGWREVYLGGSPEAEARLIQSFAEQIGRVQHDLQEREHTPAIRRAFHAKIHAGVTNAEFRVLPDLSPDFQVGFLRPGAAYSATVRFSNASGTIQPDGKRDLRGLAVRVAAGDGEAHDFLMTNAAASHARDARQFMVAARALGSRSRLLVLPQLLRGLGGRETARMLLVMARAARRVESLVTQRYWSRAPITIGPLAVKFLMAPARLDRSAERTVSAASEGWDYLREDLEARLRQGPIAFDFQVQRFVDERRTPIEDGTVEWNEADAPPQTIAQLVIPQQDLRTPEARAATAAVDKLAFNPWNTTDEFRPLGSLNRARGAVYAASSTNRKGEQLTMRESSEGAPRAAVGQAGAADWPGGALQSTTGRLAATAQTMPAAPHGALVQGAGTPDTATYDTSTRTALWRVLEGTFRIVNRFRPWHELPAWIGILNLAAFRNVLRRENLHDTSRHTPDALANVRPFDPRFLRQRTSDGTYNDLHHPEMGSAGYRFGRNVPLQFAYPEAEPALLSPSPREVSRQLLKRDAFVPATTLNLLAAAWIQFQTHDWFAHQTPLPGNEFEIPLRPGDDWESQPMRIRRTPADPTRTPAEAHLPPTYVNRDSHWWDGSQIYGSDPETTAALRSSKDGKLLIDGETQFLPLDPETGIPRTGFHDNWWVGLHILHTLFAREHNAICDHLRLENPYWPDQQIFDTARLINTALMAKIHTVDWTPAILSHPSLKIGMNANWWGLETAKIHRLLGRISEDEAIGGIPGSPTNHHGAPYSLTEEFTAVYRLHPLIPEEIAFASVTNGAPIKQLSMPQVSFANAQKVFDGDTTVADVFYSFGIAHPGAITLHNFPSFLRNLTLPDGQHLDLAAIDVLRDRERGVPRYNTFRRLLHRGPVTSFDEITDNPTWAREMREIYEGDVNRVDLMVGMYSEPLPKGFGFSDTAFRIFILMASRRLKSDRFFTVDYTPEVYTPAGLAWIDANDMSTVLLRHFPDLAPALRHVANPFAPWRRVTDW